MANNLTLEVYRLIVARIEQGETQSELAREIGVSRERIRQIYAKHGTIPYKAIELAKHEDQKIYLEEKLRLLNEEKRQRELNYYRDKIEVKNKKIFALRQNVRVRKATIEKLRRKNSEKRQQIIYLKQKIEARDRKIAKLLAKQYVPPKEVVPPRPVMPTPVEKIEEIKPEKPLKERHYKVFYTKGHCKTCGMILTGEFEQYRSKNKPNLCYSCDPTPNEEEISYTRSGLIKAGD